MQISYFAEVYNHDGRQYDICGNQKKGQKIDDFFIKNKPMNSPLWMSLDWFILYPGLKNADKKMKIEQLNSKITDLSKITDHIPAG